MKFAQHLPLRVVTALQWVPVIHDRIIHEQLGARSDFNRLIGPGGRANVVHSKSKAGCRHEEDRATVQAARDFKARRFHMLNPVWAARLPASGAWAISHPACPVLPRSKTTSAQPKS